MRIEAAIFNLPAVFFFIVAGVYGWISGGEPVGTACMLLSGVLATMIGVYFWRLSRRHGMRPEDLDEGVMDESTSEVGTYAPWSWWPLMVAASAAMLFLSLAIGWWLMVPAVMLGVIALVGWVFEFSRGQHAH